MSMRNGGGILLIIGVVLVLFFVLIQQGGPRTGSYDGLQTSWLDRLLGDDAPADFGGGDGGSDYYFSSFFGGVEFRFKVKDYRAMRDDNLGDAE